MTSQSTKQRQFIFAKRAQYKTKDNTPEKDKWIWHKDWETVKERKIKRYKPLFIESYNLEEDFHLFSMIKNKKVFLTSFMNMCKYYNKFYKMITPKASNSSIDMKVLLWDNNVATLSVDVLENGMIFVNHSKIPNNVLNIRTGQTVSWKSFIEMIKKLLETCYVRIFHSPYNDIEAADYSKIRIF